MITIYRYNVLQIARWVRAGKYSFLCGLLLFRMVFFDGIVRDNKEFSFKFGLEWTFLYSLKLLFKLLSGFVNNYAVHY